MHLLHLIAGAGGMYCRSCLHGNTLAAALRAAGEDVVLVPLYTPLHTDEEDVSVPRVAFGGINVYLQQRSALFGYLPRLVARLLDRPGLLRRAAWSGSRTRPERLGELTVSVLGGEEERQRKELDELIGWLEKLPQPHRDHARAVLRGRCGDLAALIAMDGYYADLAAECGRRAQQAVHTRYNAGVMARRTIEVYREVSHSNRDR